MLCSFALFAQPTFMRGNRLHIGVVNTSGRVEWDAGNDSNVLIKIEGSHITIYSATQQDLHCTSLLLDNENQTKWKAIDQDGGICYVYIGFNENLVSTYLMVEYSDIWYCFYTRAEE